MIFLTFNIRRRPTSLANGQIQESHGTLGIVSRHMNLTDTLEHVASHVNWLNREDPRVLVDVKLASCSTLAADLSTELVSMMGLYEIESLQTEGTENGIAD